MGAPKNILVPYIHNTKTGEWWSNEQGWVGDKQSATRFKPGDTKRLHLPIDGQWCWTNRVDLT